MRLTKLTPDQTMRYWTQIRECIAAALPPHIAENTDSMLYIQEQLLTGLLECWIGFADKNIDNIYGVMTTQIVYDSVSRHRNLLLYSVTITDDHPQEMWEHAAEQMRKYASVKGCNNIIAYSNNEHMIKIAERLGANSSWRLLTFKL